MSSISQLRGAALPRASGLSRRGVSTVQPADIAAERRRLLRLVALVAAPALLLLLSSLLAGLPPESGTLERGVTVAGADVGGKGWAESESQLRTRFDAYFAKPITLRAGNRTLQVAPRDLGARVDFNATRARAEGVGRGFVLAAAAERLDARLGGVDVTPVIVFDDTALLATLRQLGDGVVAAPVDAAFVWGQAGLSIRSAADGAGLDAAAGSTALRRQLARLDNGDVNVPVVTLKPAVATADLQDADLQAQAIALANQPLLLTADGIATWQLDAPELAGLLVYDGSQVKLDQRALAARVGTLAAAIDQQPRNATIQTNGDGTFSVVPGADARALDVQASVAAALTALGQGRREATLTVRTVPPTVTASNLEPLRARATEIVARGMRVTWTDGEASLDPAAYAQTLTFDTANGTLTFNRESLFRLLEPIAAGINRPPSGLRWREYMLVNGTDAVSGRVVDIAASVNALASAALGGQSSSVLTVNESSDPAQNGSNIVIREMLGTASTYYGSSSYNRRTNVELAAASLNGALVPPGGTFSFNNAIGGAATLDDGYQMGFGIIAGSDGTPRTVPSVAGGICQVSTTTFQAAFWAGMPIGQRNWHMYWIANYGSGPGGLTGLDATVDPESGLDFTFRNPTSDWLAIRAVTDGEWLTVEVWGTNQGWQVQVDNPVITNVVKADPTPVRQTNEQLQPGEEVIVERAQDGFTATIRRVVTDQNGTVVDEASWTSYYQPARNVTLVGPGGSVGTNGGAPTETPTAVAPADVTPAETPTQTPSQEPASPSPTVDESPTPDATPSATETQPTGADATPAG